MNKLWLVIQREYLIRVKKKSFILITLLLPVGIALLGGLSGYMASKSFDVSENILVVDDSGIFENGDNSSKSVSYTFTKEDVSSLKKTYREKGYDLLLYIPSLDSINSEKHEILYYSEEKLGIATIKVIEEKVGQVFKDYKIEKSDIDRSIYDSFATDIEMENGLLLDGGEDAADQSGKLSIMIGTTIGAIMGFFMYIVIFAYGGMVMRSVMEEKVNRIVEVMISSLKPFQMMLGKIIGVGLVGLTQVAIWITLIILITIGMQFFFGVGSDPTAIAEVMSEATGTEAQAAMSSNEVGDIIKEFKAINWLLIIPSFIIFFLGGYFIYSSLFAAIGSAIGDDMGEANQLMLPIMFPVILAFMMLQGVIANPNSNMALFGSMFPLFSPIIMPARLAFNPPLWQVLVSMVILIISSLFFVWLAARIYRVGILMYGKKITFKELSKWLFYKT
jgi:ABC-2 type transport system permease protein